MKPTIFSSIPIKIGLLFILQKLLYLVLAFGLSEKEVRPSNLYDLYHSAMKKHDSYWYQDITFHGYDPIESERDLGYAEQANIKQSNWAFFPAYPLLNRLVVRFFKIRFDDAAFALSLMLGYMLYLGLFYLMRQDFDERSSLIMLLLIVFAPFSYVLSTYYSECLFLLLLVSILRSIHAQRYLIASALTAMLVLTRPNGLFMLLPICLYLYENRVERISSRGAFLNATRVIIRRLITFTNPFGIITFSGLVSFSGWLWYQYEETGFPLAFSIAQRGWGRDLSWPWESFFNAGNIAVQFNSIYLIIIIIWFVLIVKRLRTSYGWFVGLSLFVPLISGSVFSMQRFVSILFPLWASLSKLKMGSTAGLLLLFLYIVVHYFTFVCWLLGYPFAI